MNELKIEFSNKSYLYFKTNKRYASSAFEEFVETCENAGINLDNMIITELVLRDDEYNDINRMNV